MNIDIDNIVSFAAGSACTISLQIVWKRLKKSQDVNVRGDGNTIVKDNQAGGHIAAGDISTGNDSSDAKKAPQRKR